MSNWTPLWNLSLKSTAILGLAWIVTLLLSRRSAATRHLVWTAAWTVLFAIPLLSLSLPAWPHRFANAIFPADPGLTFHSTSVARAAETSAHTPVTVPSAIPANTSTPTFDPRRVAILLWSAGALAAFAHMLLAYASVWRLRSTATPCAHHFATLGIKDRLPLFETPHAIPMTAGIFHPAIFLPTEAAAWPAERLRLVVLHEQAHISRGDAATQLIARTALCLHWWNPLAWFAWRKFLNERERAADDLVLETGACASDYAGHLLEIARSSQAAPVAVAAGVAMARRSQLEGRLLAILDSRVKRSHPGRWAVAAALIAALTIATPLATVRAQSQSERQLPADLDATIRAASTQKNHELIEEAAKRFEDLRKFDEAQMLREAALAIRQQSGEGSATYAVGLVKLGDLAMHRSAFPEAMGYYKRAANVGDMPETIPALIHLGLNAYSEHDTANARDYITRARNASRSGNDQSRTMTWLAFVQKDDPANTAQVESLYRTAISVAEAGSPDQALSMELLARFLRSQGRPEEADGLQQTARSIRTSAIAAVSSQMAISTPPSRVRPGITPPKLLFKVEPEFSEAARAAKYQGTVLLNVVIDVDGLAKNISVLQGLGLGLDEKAAEAIARWRFKPGQSGGVDIPVEAQVEVNFRLL